MEDFFRLFDMRPCFLGDVIALLIAFVLAAAEIVDSNGLFADEVLADFGNSLRVGLLDLVSSGLVELGF